MSSHPTPNHGPELLDERSIIGIAVHPVALFTGILGAGLIYLVSDHAYTKANARNALNWHLSVLVLTVLAFLTFFLGADELTVGGEPVEWSLVPAPIDTVFFLVGVLLLLGAMLAWLFTVVFAAIATGKAIFGTAWAYPLAYEFVDEESGE